jgi:bifunctional polynucleotide phosphatase/kinase
VHVNQDTLGSRPKCVKAAEEAVAAGKSCVIGLLSPLSCLCYPFTSASYADNTNRDVQTRKYYLDVAKRLQVSARYRVLGSLLHPHT